MTFCLYWPVCKHEESCNKKMSHKAYENRVRVGMLPKVYDLPPNCYQLQIPARTRT